MWHVQLVRRSIALSLSRCLWLAVNAIILLYFGRSPFNPRLHTKKAVGNLPLVGTERLKLNWRL